MKRLLMVSMALPLLAACGTLEVRVSALKPQVAEGETDRVLFRSRMPLINAENAETIGDRYTEMENAHARALFETAAAYTAAGHKEDGDSLLAVVPVVSKKYEEEKERVIALTKRIQTSTADSERSALIRQLDREQGNFLQASGRSLKEEVRRARERGLDLPQSTLQAVSEQDATAQQLLIGNSNITHDAIAYVVSSAPKDAWSDIFDRSYGSGRLGRMDLAIKMETRGVFTIKGVSFDPSAVARAASKALSQGVILAAQMAGVPLKSGTFSGDGAALATASGTLTTADDQTAIAEAKVADKKNALLELAQQILAQRESLENGDADRIKAAMAAIEAKLAATKTRLTAQ